MASTRDDNDPNGAPAFPEGTFPEGSSPATTASTTRARMPMAARGTAHGARAALAVAVLALAAGCGGDDSGASPPTPTRRADAVRPALETLRAAFEAGDPAPILATFADDVQLHSPALMSPEYRGRDVVASIVTPAMQVLEDVRVTDVLQTGDGGTGGVVFDARVGELPAQGVVLLRAKGERVSEITLLLRPLPTLRAFVTRMGELGAKPALDAGKG